MSLLCPKLWWKCQIHFLQLLLQTLLFFQFVITLPAGMVSIYTFQRYTALYFTIGWISTSGLVDSRGCCCLVTTITVAMIQLILRLNLSSNLQSNSVSSQHLGQSSHQLLPEAIYSACVPKNKNNESLQKFSLKVTFKNWRKKLWVMGWIDEVGI